MLKVIFKITHLLLCIKEKMYNILYIYHKKILICLIIILLNSE
jgi:hypothetical protein